MTSLRSAPVSGTPGDQVGLWPHAEYAAEYAHLSQVLDIDKHMSQVHQVVRMDYDHKQKVPFCLRYTRLDTDTLNTQGS